jgi:hypothetical protein
MHIVHEAYIPLRGELRLRLRGRENNATAGVLGVVDQTGPCLLACKRVIRPRERLDMENQEASEAEDILT